VKLRLRDRTVDLDPGGRPDRAGPLVMGVVNANPDSFADRLRLGDLSAQVAHALSLVEQGADLIDVGGESGVTYTNITAAELELERVLPLVRRLVAEGITVSVDTWKPQVAAAVLDAGAAMINDVSGLRDPALADACAATGAALVVMHTRAEPKQAELPDYRGDVMGDVLRFLAERAAVALERGVRPEQLVVDPGPDFAKTPQESVEVLRGIHRVRALGRPVLLAVSRKYFVGVITGRPPDERLAGTLAAVAAGVDAGASIVRVHDVAATVDFLRVRDVVAGRREMPPFDPEDEALKWIRDSDYREAAHR
jgi:dihydropteroate synthase